MNYKLSVFTVSVLAVLVGCTSQPTPSAEWSCRNILTEIACSGTDCTLAPVGEFTPMELTFDTDGGMLLCAYSGCWNGSAVEISTAGNYFSVVGLAMPWSGTDAAPADISATINMKTMVAVVLTDDYAHPMICEIS